MAESEQGRERHVGRGPHAIHTAPDRHGLEEFIRRAARQNHVDPLLQIVGCGEERIDIGVGSGSHALDEIRLARLQQADGK